MHVSNVLKSKARAVVVCAPDHTLSDVANLLAQHGIGALVVTNGSGHVLGIISERDIIRLLSRHGPDVLTATVSDHMTRKVITCGERESIDRVMSIMNDNRFRHMPVVEQGRLIGIVSLGDMVREHIAAVENEATLMRAYIAAS